MNCRLARAAAILTFATGLSTWWPQSATADPGPDSAAPPATAAQDSVTSSRRALELEQIVVTGNSRVTESDILGTLRLTARDTVNAAMLEQARLRLLREHDALAAVLFATRPGSSRGLIILDVTVSERKRVTFETGYGQHDVYGWFLTLLGVRAHPGSAGGTEAALGLRLGFRIAGLDGKLERRGSARGVGFGGNFHLYSQEHTFYSDTAGGGANTLEFSQDIGRAGAELYLFDLPSRFTRAAFGFRVESVRPESSFVQSGTGQEYFFADFPPSLQPDIRHTLITGFFFRYVRDTRDLVAYPGSGSLSFVEVQSNQEFLGGDVSYAKVRLDVRKHFGLGHDRVLSGRLAGGLVSKEAPYHERFYLGGIYTVRGFRELSLSPPSGDDGFAIASAELRVPLVPAAKAPPRLSGILFVDAGMGWRHDEPMESSTLDAAAGYGLHLRLPWLGTLGVDVGIPITSGRTGDRFRVHGVLGFSF